MNLPKEFIEYIEKLFCEPVETAAFLESLRGGRHFGLRVNPLKIGPRDFAARFDNIEPVPWCATGFYYTGSDVMSKNPLYHAGLYYIQEPSAMSAASILDVRPGDRVLDLCASPGGKSTQIAGCLANYGLLVANDANHSRIPQLVRNIEAAGIKNAVILREKPERLAKHFPEYFDKILVDAPCSGEGMFRKNPEAAAAWDKNKAARLAVIQKDILHNASKMLAPQGCMVYSTCTFNGVENEEVVQDFLESHEDFSLETIDHEKFGISPAGQGLVGAANNRAARIWPHRHRGEGHFIALLRKRGGGAAREMELQPVSKFDIKFYDEFCEKHLIKSPEGKIYAHGDRLYALTDDCPSLGGLNVVRPGLYLGSLQKQRFIPSFALAMSLSKEDFKSESIIDMEAGDPRVELYLKGETFRLNAGDGYNLFCVQSFPLGFAKLLDGRLKGRINGR